MFQNLTERLSQTFKHLSGRGRLTDENIQEALQQIRIALLEADVALPVIKQFIEDVRQKAIGQVTLQTLDPGQTFISIVRDEMTKIMGESNSTLNLQAQPPAVVLLVGLQGSGKTTTAAKLAHWLMTQEKKTVMLVSTDIYRPAAIEQLKTLAQQIDAGFHPSHVNQKPVDIAKAALQAARNQSADVLIIDSAGRLHVDEQLMQEMQQIHAAINPIETLFVVDSMTGQDAAHTAQAFNQAIPLTGIILTKADGDARGGAALSVRQITGKPIKFMGVGEKITGLEAFYPDRIASRILGMGDMLSLIEQAEKKINKQEAEKLSKKLQKGSFDLEDFKTQIVQMSKMGSMQELLDKIPGMSGLPMAGIDNQLMKHYIAMIDSMTPQERRFPNLIKGSRKKRITEGSGTDVVKLNRLLKQFDQMQMMMKKVTKKGGLQKLMRNFQGKLPFGGGF